MSVWWATAAAMAVAEDGAKASSHKEAASENAADGQSPVANAADPLSTEIHDEERERVAQIVADVRRLWKENPRSPLPADSRTPSAKERTRTYNEWIQSLYVDAWRAHGQHDRRWDDRALALLRDFSKPSGAKESRDFAERARQLLSEGCDDLLIRYVLARSFDLSAGNAAHRVINQLKPKIESLSADYSAPVAYRIEMRYVEAWHRAYSGNLKQVSQIVDRMLDRIVKMISRPLTNEERRRHLQRLSVDMDGVLGKFPERFFKKLAAAPQADRWLVQMLLARAHVNLGWQVRGGGYANTVTEKGWQEFGARLKKARALLLQAWQEYPELPEAAAELIAVTMAVGGAAEEDCRFWFDLAVAADLDLEIAYRKLLWALRPRWGGSHEEIISFGRECLATRRFDLDTLWRFHTAVCEVLSEVEDFREVCGAPGIYEDYLALIEGARAVAENDFVRRQLDAVQACVACFSGREDEARRLLDQLGSDAPLHTFTQFHTTLGDVRLALSGGKRAPPGEAWAACDIDQLRFTADAERLVGFGTRSGLRGWDLAGSGQLAFELPIEVDGRLMRDADLSPDGKLLALILVQSGKEMQTGSVVLWDVAERKVLRTLPPAPSRPAYRLQFSPDGKRLAAGSLDGSVTIWDVETGQRPAWGHWRAHQSWVQTMAFTADGKRLATAGGDWNVMLWELPEPGDAANKPLDAKATWGAFATMPVSLSFSPDGKRLLIGHSYCDVWNVETGKPMRRLPGSRVAFSPDGKTLATGGGELFNEARVWDAVSLQERARLVGGHEYALTSLVYSPNGHRLVTGSSGSTDAVSRWQGTMRCWDVQTGEDIPDFSGCSK